MGKVKGSYSVKEKLKIVQWHDTHGCNVSLTSRTFGIDRKRVREWYQKRHDMMQHNYGSEKFKRRLCSGRPVLSEELDDSLFEYLQRERGEGRTVSNRMLAEEAQSIANCLGTKEFKASSQYLKRWKKRFNVTMQKGTSESQNLPEDYKEAIDAYFRSIQSYRKANDYIKIANMDETMVRFDSSVARTNNVAGESTIHIANTGCTKRGFTVVLAGCASGQKFPAFIIFKEPSGIISPKVHASLKVPKNVCITSSLNGWMTSECMADWVHRVWGDNNDDVRRLLVLDQAPIHKTSATMEAIAKTDTDIVFVPPGCTSLVQPADVSWNKPFKDNLCLCWNNFRMKNEETPARNNKNPSRQDMINFVSSSWEAVSEDNIRKSFNLCGIFVDGPLDGSENGIVHENLADVGAASDNSVEIKQECLELVFVSDSEESFDGFSDEDDS